VDDAVVMRRLVKQYLGQMGFNQVYEADNGRSALDILAEEKVGLVISDWLMPDMDGLQLLRTIRNDAPLKHIPFLMMTLLDQKDKVVEAVQAGVTDYLVKPLNFEIFSDKVKRILKGMRHEEDPGTSPD